MAGADLLDLVVEPVQQGARRRRLQEPEVAQALVGLALDEQPLPGDDLELLPRREVDPVELGAGRARDLVEPRGHRLVADAEVVHPRERRLGAAQPGHGREEALGPGRAVEPEAMDERSDRRRVEQEGREHGPAGHGDEQVALGQRLGERDAAAQAAPDEDRLVATADGRDPRDALERRHQRHTASARATSTTTIASAIAPRSSTSRPGSMARPMSRNSSALAT